VGTDSRYYPCKDELLDRDFVQQMSIKTSVEGFAAGQPRNREAPEKEEAWPYGE